MSQPKWNGHLAMIRKDGPIQVISRHNKPLPISKPMLDSLSRIGLVDGDEVYGEWTSRRESNKEEGMYLFNWSFSRYEWLGSTPEEDRYKKLGDLKLVDNVFVVDSRNDTYAQHYKSTIDNYKLEGIVLKLRKAKMIGDRSPKDNPGYMKLKWLGGSDGLTRRIVPDSELVMRI